MARKTKAELEAEATGKLLGLVLLGALALVTLIALISPGLLAVSVLRDTTNLDLSAQQTWTFSILAAAAIVFGLKSLRRDWAKGIRLYLQLCAGITLVFALLHFGLGSHLPRRYLEYLSFRPDADALPEVEGVPGAVPGSSSRPHVEQRDAPIRGTAGM